ncbi:carboxypeptidase-like regulatory domain-containing protein [Flagellimonas sp. DF-77]|uniref:carboxypeptidase-like regulatory domain-containing protein n=1 Tax=Flagellimonas algarum TaxID=3230298 RepID=UPI003391B06B
MKKLFLCLFLATSFCFAQNTSKTIRGMVTDGRSTIENVAVGIEGSSNSTYTDASGKYELAAEVGDILTFSYQGLKTVRIKVEDVTRILNPTMVPDIEQLEEVTVVGSNRKSQSELAVEYQQNPNIIRTAFGYLNAETAPGNIKFMREDEINSVAICILDLLRNEFAGVRVQGSCLGAFGPGAGSSTQLTNITAQNSNNPGVVGLSDQGTGIQSALNSGKVFIRSGNSLFNPRSAIFDVDGQIFNDAPIWIDVKNIKRIAILNNFATTTAYGSAGAGGVIVVNTIVASPRSNKIVDQARLRNNFVAGNIKTQEELQRNWPSYLQDLYNSGSLEEAKQTYAKNAKIYSSSPYYFMDAQKYFVEKWNDKGYADDLIGSNFALFDNNPVLLKALAYHYEEQGEFEQANHFYKKVLKLRPDYAQSYVDMANSYRDLRDAKQAASIYTRYNYLIEDGMMEMDSVDFATIFEREYNNFLLLDKNAVVTGEKSSELYIAEEDFEGTRLVFEWDNSEAEFELQFVNPQNQYHTIKHSLADNEAKVMRGKDFGYSISEYLVDGSLPGKWTVNARYLGNKSLTPSYLKATVYYNYGTYAQRKEVKVFKLSLKDIPQELFTIAVGSKLVSR